MLINLGIIDFNVGNLRSLLQIFNIISLNYNIIFIKNKNDFNKIDKLILPGQSSIFSCLNFLKKNDLFDHLINFSNYKPVLGICVGKQIFFSESEEDKKLISLNFFKGDVKKIKSNNFLKVPHIGWNKVKFIKKHFLLNGICSLKYFYFSHSFYVLPNDFEFIYGLTRYGIVFSSIFIKKNIFLTQFHPEKSFLSGIRMIYNFSIWNI